MSPRYNKGSICLFGATEQLPISHLLAFLIFCVRARKREFYEDTLRCHCQLQVDYHSSVIFLFNFRRGRDTFPLPPLCGRPFVHCVSGFRVYVFEVGTDTYPNFWRRFSFTGTCTLLLQWSSGTVVRLGWSNSEMLLCVQDDGVVIEYDMFGNLCRHFSMGQVSVYLYIPFMVTVDALSLKDNFTVTVLLPY